jgi:large subunit ribosomal protein L19
MQKLIEEALKDQLKKNLAEDFNFKVGDAVKVHCRLVDQGKDRVQIFSGIVISRRGRGISKTFTVRKVVNDSAVEKTFPLHSPMVLKVETVRKSRVLPSAKMYYLRCRIGKEASRVRE